MRNNVFITSDLIPTTAEEREQIRHLQMKSREQVAQVTVNSKCSKCKNFESCKAACLCCCEHEVYCDNIHCLNLTLLNVGGGLND